MRIRSGHKPEDWIDCPPANPGSMPIRGALVVGASSNPSHHRKLGDNSLEGGTANLQNQGVKSTIPEVRL